MNYLILLLKRVVYILTHIVLFPILILWVALFSLIMSLSLPFVYLFTGKTYTDFWADWIFLPATVCHNIGYVLGLEDYRL